MSKPSYADHTFAPWRLVRDNWVVAIESTWKKPLQWKTKAKNAESRKRVFVAVDVFNDGQGAILDIKADQLWWGTDKYGLPIWETESGRDPHPVSMADVRNRLFSLINDTPHLDWLLVTEQPQNIAAMMPPLGWIKHPCPKHVSQFRLECPACNAKNSTPVTRKNLWLGVRITDQQTADERIPHLLKVPAKVRFVDAVLRGPVDLDCYSESGCSRNWLDDEPGIDWLTVSGESGPHARPMHPDWVRSLRDQCAAAGVPFWFNSWGEWIGMPDYDFITHGSDIDQWDKDMLFPNGVSSNSIPREERPDYCQKSGTLPISVMRIGKAAAGRTLDGKEWKEVPT